MVVKDYLDGFEAEKNRLAHFVTAFETTKKQLLQPFKPPAPARNCVKCPVYSNGCILYLSVPLPDRVIDARKRSR